MFSLPNFSVKRPVCILICVISLIAFGISSVFSMPIESTPEMNMPVLMVMTRYSDASPDEIDKMVTDKVEAALMGISDVDTMTSTSSEGSSMTMMEFGYDVDIDDKYQDVVSAVSMLNLPDGCDDPMVMEMNMSSMNNSIMSISVDSDSANSGKVVAYVEDVVVPEIERIEGIAEVSVSGGSREYIRILLDENKLNQYGLKMKDVSDAIAAAEYEVTLGDMDRGNTTLSLIGSQSYTTYRQLENVQISLGSGDIINVSDVAEVSMATQERTSMSRQNGKDNISISVTKEQSANTINICNEIVALIDGMNADSSIGLSMEITSNTGETIMDNINSVISSLVMGLVVAMFVLIFFFGEWKSSFIVGITMPLSVFAALVMMAVFDMTINLMSLGGLVVGIGMMVDNAIVVLDSCFKNRDEERSFAESVAIGANLVTSSIIASTATTVVVFLPIALMNGMSGQLFKDVCFTIVFALLASLLGALTLVPLLFVKMKPVEKQGLSHKMLAFIDVYYEKILRVALKGRVFVVVIAIACLGIAGMLFTQIKMELMPNMDQGSVNLSIETKSGLNLESTNEIMSQIEAIVAAEEDVESYSLRVSGGGGRGGSSSSGGSLSITLKDDRVGSTDDFVSELRAKTADIENCVVDVSQNSGMSFGGGGKVQISLVGKNLDDLEAAADAIKAELAVLPEFDAVTTSLSSGSQRARVEVDPILAGSVGMTPSSVLSAASNKISGVTAMEFQEDDTEYSVKVQYDSDRYKNISDLAGLMIDTPGGGQVALTDIAQVVYEVGPTSISREDGEYIVTVSATPKVGANAAALTTSAMAKANALDLPETVTIGKGGDISTMNTEFAAIGTALIIAVFLVFAVMSIQFESLIFAFVVMISIPFSLTGAFLALYLTGSSISMTSLIGFVMLVGVVVNNAIVLVDFANHLRRNEGMEVREALVMAGRTRLRPILMSSLTTIVGLIPMAIGFGGEVEMMQGMSVVVIGGLSLSTVLTLLLIPTFYLIFDKEDRRDRKTQRKAKRLKPVEVVETED